MRVTVALIVVALLTALAILATGVIAVGAVSSLDDEGPADVPGIPAPYLRAYRAAAVRFHLGTAGWSYLAAIGKVESDHGRSTAAGVHSGENAYGCCAGPMQIDNGSGSGGGTWGAYATDGDGDGRLDIYDPDDAVTTAARYLRASGAPADWPRAVFAYNHAGWYVDRVLKLAARYRVSSVSRAGVVVTDRLVGARGWLSPVPGFPGERCDRRIVPDVVALTRAYGLTLIDCFGGLPHETAGEHPLGLAADLAPIDGDWSRTERLARAAGWRPSCASTGCAGRGPFRVVLYNGYPGHGDPRYSTRPHLHLSWQHGPVAPFHPAPWVRLVLSSPAEVGP